MIPTPALAEHPFEPDDDDRSDGRRLRAARNRESVVSAVLDIIREQGGGPLPGAAEVAERAGVSERTVFRHFADLDTLFLAASARQRPTVLTYLTPRPDMPELDKRIAAMVKLRSKLWEEIGAVRRVAMRLAAAHSVVSTQIGDANRAARGQISDVFQPELTRAGKERNLVLDELELIMSWSSWEMLRSLQGSSPERARRTVTELMSAVLTRYAAPARKQPSAAKAGR